MTLSSAFVLWLLALVPAHAQDHPLYGVPWGDERSCAAPGFHSSNEPPRHWVPKPYYVGEGFISVGSQFCRLTGIEAEPGSYVADCEFAHGDERRRYTIAMLEEDDTLTMVWKSLASSETYPAKIGPLHRCGLGGAVPVPWKKSEFLWPKTD